MNMIDVSDPHAVDTLDENAAADLLHVYSHSVLWGAPLRVQEFIEHEDEKHEAV